MRSELGSYSSVAWPTAASMTRGKGLRHLAVLRSAMSGSWAFRSIRADPWLVCVCVSRCSAAKLTLGAFAPVGSARSVSPWRSAPSMGSGTGGGSLDPVPANYGESDAHHLACRHVSVVGPLARLGGLLLAQLFRQRGGLAVYALGTVVRVEALHHFGQGRQQALQDR